MIGCSVKCWGTLTLKNRIFRKLTQVKLVCARAKVSRSSGEQSGIVGKTVCSPIDRRTSYNSSETIVGRGKK